MARFIVVVFAVIASMALTARAEAAISEVFSSTSDPIPCAVQENGVRLCDQTVAGTPRSTVKAFDGVPIDVRVAFPPEPESGPDGPYPLLMLFSGYAGSKRPLGFMNRFLDDGYATFSMTTRGFGASCGTQASRDADPEGCAAGHVRMMDTRYEVRDAQEFAALLADEGRTSYTQIGALGSSYGGALTMALGALKNRKMLPDGSLVAWESPGGTPMQIAAAVPEIPWTDLAYSLMPNGSTLDYVADAPYLGRTGVLKSSWENALYNNGNSQGFFAAAGTDPDADMRNWHTTFNNGEPYDDATGDPLPAAADIRDELTTHHSSYYIDPSVAPAPMLISSGWTDDLFPATEAIRYYNRTRTQHPGAPISLFLGSFGHQRGQAKADAVDAREPLELAWLDHYVRGVGSPPLAGVTAYTQTCPNAAASGGPFTATSLQQLAPGEVRFASPDAQAISPEAGSSAIAAAFDPVSGDGACATTPAADEVGTATYRMDPVPEGGFTLMGSPTVIADVTSPGSDSQVAARLLDVDPSTDTQTLVARALWRPDITLGPQRQVFQLHGNGYRVAAGHLLKLELLPDDYNTTPNNSYGRFSNNQQSVFIEDLELRLPVVESPGALGGLVRAPAAKVLPPGYELAAGFPGPGYVRPGSAPSIKVALVPAFQPCADPNRVHGPPEEMPSCNPPQPVSDYLTVGAPDNNGLPAEFTGAVQYKALAGTPPTTTDDADVRLTATLHDIRSQGSLTAYEGELLIDTVLRITDRRNGPETNESATVQDIPFSVAVPCSAPPEAAGSTCSVSTTLDAVAPGAVPEGKRSVWAFESIEVYDGGADGEAETADNTLFARQGLFVP